MPSKNILISSLILCALVAIAGVASASGSHSTDHSHGDAAIGMPGAISRVNRTVPIVMNDEMRFIPDHITVKQGETVRFTLKNTGTMDHEFVLGTEQELTRHKELMKKFPEMEHDDPNMITVAPGKTDVIVWHFTRKGNVDFACLLPGHFDDGMKGSIKVLP